MEFVDIVKSQRCQRMVFSHKGTSFVCELPEMHPRLKNRKDITASARVYVASAKGQLEDFSIVERRPVAKNVGELFAGVDELFCSHVGLREG
jgi:hypothetical protein